MSKFNCPFCNHEHDYYDTDLWEEGSGTTDYECRSCNRTFEIEIEFTAEVYPSVPDDAPIRDSIFIEEKE